VVPGATLPSSRAAIRFVNAWQAHDKRMFWQVGHSARDQQAGTAHRAHAHTADRGLPLHGPRPHHVQPAAGGYKRRSAVTLLLLDCATTKVVVDVSVACLLGVGRQWAGLRRPVGGSCPGAGIVRRCWQHPGTQPHNCAGVDHEIMLPQAWSSTSDNGFPSHCRWLCAMASSTRLHLALTACRPACS
jgi:hypothetical protein